MLKKINPEADFICLNDKNSENFDIDLVYASADHPHNYFGNIYQSRSKLWMHKKLYKILIDALTYLPKDYSLSVKDSFRSCEAQYAMSLSPISDHLYKNGFISKVGQGAHPRGMAVDLTLKYKRVEVDAGASFDNFDFDSNEEPLASRVRKSLTIEQHKNQKILENAMVRAAIDNQSLIMPLEHENWDFRFPKNISSLKYVLKSIARVLDKPIDFPEIKSYEHFIGLWQRYFNVAAELTIPKFEEVLFTQNYDPLFDIDIPFEMRMTDCTLTKEAKLQLKQ